MATFLWDKIVFGPIKSRRLGASLGINLLPISRKVCTFDCVYCECGFNIDGKGNNKFPTKEEVKTALENKLKEVKENKETVDSITFSGNGEPTLHPDFEIIINDTIALRNKYFPNAKISVLSNSTTIDRSSVFSALEKVDNNLLKLDAGFDFLIKNIDQPVNNKFNTDSLVDNLKQFKGNLTIQTIFLRGEHNGKSVDNTTPENLNSWLNLIKEIKPKAVMIYSLDRETPSKTLEKVSKEELETIADKVRANGIEVTVA
ncbi:wyosine [tRNA(Phe)-imidazoG37] synthetase (radical SAM superfamily) [Dysgonomonadaceae bacterium PH5-43]|nr:wyosine [tRNA(Phe)-imidazoG37] synthetase (radical SAM superfamily) [Dysgonomonadaceae bacterium PH5-43]